MTNTLASALGNSSRRNITVLAADIAGFTALTQSDEDWAFARVTEVMEEVIAVLTAGQGHVVDRAGDGLLALFPGALQALAAALAVRDRVEVMTATDPAGRRISLRIGINVGEAIVNDDRVFGTVVNVAARLQSLAEPGGIVISGAAVEATRGTNSAALEDLGGLAVRGLGKPVRCFQVRRMRDVPPALHPALPDKPSIAILPFENLSADPDQSYFADGLVTDLIAGLACLPSIFVVPRSSSFRFRDRALPSSQITLELGVRYLLEGTVRRSGQRLRVTSELLEGESGTQLWSGRFDGSVDEVFDLQDKVTETVAAVIEPRLLFAEVERARRAPPDDLQAHDLFLQATGYFYAMGRQDVERAKELTDRALRLDPNNARCLALGARCRLHRKVQGWVPPTDPSIAEGARMGRRAALLAGMDPEVLWMAGIVVALADGDVRGGIAMIDRALAINPNSADALTYSGMARAYLGDADVALQHLARAQQLSPVDAQTYNKQTAAAWATFGVGRYEDCLTWTERALASKPDYAPPWRLRAACFGLLGHLEEGREAVLRLLALSPEETCASTLVYYTPSFPAPGAVSALVDGLGRAGLPVG
ncbi:MAG: hypothetical protein JWO26_1227 [Rhodospirillales bacterium]|nr:hypothetical protein [Rhodospirillales bacterium]MDB5381595.1 hypothetical protein [Rhodospirillales bacterium]